MAITHKLEVNPEDRWMPWNPYVFFVQHPFSPHSHSTPQKQPHEKPAPGRAVRIAALPVGRPGGRTKLLRTAWKTVKTVAAMVEKRMELSNQNGFIKVYQAELRLNGWTWMGFKVLAINQQDFLDIRWSLWWTHNKLNGWRWPCSAMLVYHRVISNRWNFKPHVCRDSVDLFPHLYPLPSVFERRWPSFHEKK